MEDPVLTVRGPHLKKSVTGRTRWPPEEAEATGITERTEGDREVSLERIPDIQMDQAIKRGRVIWTAIEGAESKLKRLLQREKPYMFSQNVKLYF